jgi:hypothetical protein
MSYSTTTVRTIVAVLLTFAVAAPAAEKAPLRDEFQRLYAGLSSNQYRQDSMNPYR